MKIAIDIRNRYLIDETLSRFTVKFWHDLAIFKPDHEFIFITTPGPDAGPSLKNVQVEPLKQLNIAWIDERRLQGVFNEWQADRIIGQQQTGFSIASFFKKNKTKDPAADARQLILFEGAAIPAKIGNNDTISMIQPAWTTVIDSLSWAETESIKTQYTGGRDFFLFAGDIGHQHQLIELLQAFSSFKKWQQSNMQLVIAGCGTAWTAGFEEKLLTYKYRSDVVVLKNMEELELAKLLAVSYAFVYPAMENIFPLSLIWAVQSHKAIITTDTPAARAITDAAVWVQPQQTAEGFSKAMILLYKDENYRQDLVGQIKKQAKQFSRRQMLDTAWLYIGQ